ncbi:MAG: aminomethyl-transferring glycine dehydrogenase subunit GcvPB [Candidatus Hatepunaea meridiana]|nr:aminomethyl-transferring glycine dehydrogenase subunit GcvPB [Candidatus Hatepunaea meridiana]
MPIPLIFEQNNPAIHCSHIPKSDIPDDVQGLPDDLRRQELDLPQVAEPEVMRHFVNLSTMNHHVDKGFYPLGSCTMKYNPKVNENISALPGFAGLHPYQPASTIQGALKMMLSLEEWLCEITGLPAVTLQPAAGSHGELTGMFLTQAYHLANGEHRKKVLIPDSSHGTNPASIVMAGFEPVHIPSNERGRIDIAALQNALKPDVAALMVTNPSTLGLFEDQIDEVAEAVHSIGALLYMDGANMNALMGLARPGDMGFDIVHLNLHKTFSTPHGGGGPGSGPVAVIAELEKFLPIPRIKVDGVENPDWDWDRPDSIGRVQSFFGNFSILVRAAAYIRSLGGEGFKNVSETAILNANYIRTRLMDIYKLPYNDLCMHEVVFSADNQSNDGLKAVNIAKRLLDFGIHAPTINFPLIVHEALMIEPTETETLGTLDNFIEVMRRIDQEVNETPEMLKNAPLKTPVFRLDEVMAARKLDVKYEG